MTGRLWRIAVLMAASAFGSASQAKAAHYYWLDSFPGYSQPGPTFPQRPRARPRQTKKIEAPAKQSIKPQGPLIIAISIEKQNLRVYDANGFFAETPISTGMKGHPTPMGVFSIIQKHRLHHSNIYSGAPMPFMQRITWSGIAMHAGALPGYPASHGCIRMPLAFATKIWGWTKMGVRVVITPGAITPAGFSHPLLATQKISPQPAAANEPKPDAATKTDKAADADTTRNSATSEARFELRSTVGHGDGAGSVMGEPSAATPLRERTHTADARSVLPAMNASVTMSDAGSSARGAGDLSPPQDAAAINRGEAPSSNDKAVETKSPEAAIAEPTVAAPASADSVTTAASASEGTKADETTAATDVQHGAADVKKDQTRLPITGTTASKPEPPKRTGQIAAFVSRKDGKLYVRQNFAPLFDVPVTIAPSDRPLGTHVFTARVDKDDANVLHWSAVSLPASSRYAGRREEDERSSRRRKMTGAVETRPVPIANSAAEALDRLSIPADAMARITEALSTGGSIIVSDHGIAAGGETGEGTDFVVPLR